METKNFAFGGITRSIGGAVCGDGDLHIAVDVCNDGAGLTLLEKEKVLFTMATGEEFLCIHDPEGEEDKHYISQLVIEAPATQTRDGGSIEQEGDDPEEQSETVVTGPIEPYNPYVEPTTPPSEPVQQDEDNPYASTDSYEPPTVDEEVPTVYEELIAAEELKRNEDSGGTSYLPPSGGAITVPTSPGIYLIWRKDNGNGTSTIMQIIDISDYGAVNAVQPMGNTLICNHNGTDEASSSLRYYLFNIEQSEYLPLGSNPPFINIRFGLESTFEYYPKTKTTFKNNNSEVNVYGGTQVQVRGYTDAIHVGTGEGESEGYNWAAPYNVYNGSFGYWKPTYTLEGVVSTPNNATDVAGMKLDLTRGILGCYNKFIAEQQKENKFVFPFFVRYAYELYDGSLIMHSYPVLMIPNSRGPIFALDGKRGIRAAIYHAGDSYESVRITIQGRTYGFASTLMHQVSALTSAEHTRLAYWKDLIRGINIYVTPPIYNYDQSGQVLGWHCMSSSDPANNNEDPWLKYYTTGKVKYGSNSVKSGDVLMGYAFSNMLNDNGVFWPYDTTNYKCPDYCMTIPQKDQRDILELYENAGQFYKLASIEFDTLLEYTEDGTTDGAVSLRNRILETIANQDFMQDDNHSHDALSSDVLYGYNRRLNMANVEHRLHSPLPLSTQWAHEYTSEGTSSSDPWHYYHEILHVNNNGRTAKLCTTASNLQTTWPKFIFYPNTDAKEAFIIRDGSLKYQIKLKEHKALNGVFWLGDFMERADCISDCQMNNTAAAAITELSQETNTIVDESSKIYTSETDNPFYVPLGNINIAGGGEVRALCAATQAMSQGQFGQHPMYCFTSEGVWAMTVNDTGGWGTIQPVTRDVINSGTKPLSLDSTVLFLSDRGLLQLAGAETTPLSGAVRSYDYSTYSKLADATGFTGLATATNTGALLTAANALTAFPDVAVLTYDAKSGRVYVTPVGVGASWVLNLRSGLWTQATTHIDTQVPTYPGCEGQQGNQIVEIGSTLGYQKDKGLVVTRPVKFGDGSILKRITEMAVRGQFRPYGGKLTTSPTRTENPPCVQTALWGTREWLNFALVASSKNNRLTRWGGSPYFGHAFGLFLTKPSDYILHVVGVDAVVDIERVNKIR